GYGSLETRGSLIIAIENAERRAERIQQYGRIGFARDSSRQKFRGALHFALAIEEIAAFEEGACIAWRHVSGVFELPLSPPEIVMLFAPQPADQGGPRGNAFRKLVESPFRNRRGKRRCRALGQLHHSVCNQRQGLGRHLDDLFVEPAGL